MRTLIIQFISLTALLIFAYPPAFANSSDPVSMLQHVASNMITGLKNNKATLKTKPDIVFNLAYRYVVPNADLAEMSKRVLPPSVWNNATAAERKQFQQEFTTTIIRTYASALTSYEDQTVKFFPVRGNYANAKTVEVSGEIVSNQTQPIHVSYRLIRSNNNWKLIDMSVEGVSMLDSFRAQFSGIVSQGSMSQLLAQISNHNHRVAQ